MPIGTGVAIGMLLDSAAGSPPAIGGNPRDSPPVSFMGATKPMLLWREVMACIAMFRLILGTAMGKGKPAGTPPTCIPPPCVATVGAVVAGMKFGVNAYGLERCCRGSFLLAAFNFATSRDFRDCLLTFLAALSRRSFFT